MTVISAASAGVKDMADGSLRITFEFEPRHAADAFALFGPRGRSVAIAALADGHARASDTSPEPVVETPKKEHKGGEWAKLAGMWCADPDFWAFLNQQFPGDDLVTTADQAAMSVRVYCDIASRAELDHSKEALYLFKQRFIYPFQKWMKAVGIQK
jgi:hypothetical protein